MRRTAILMTLILAAAGPAGAVCGGDCGGDGLVTVCLLYTSDAADEL